MVKYSISEISSHKGIIFQWNKDIYDELNPEVNWEDFIKILALDDRIGNSHVIPGHDGKRLWGSMFHQRYSPLINYSNSIDKFELLEKIVHLNNSLRKSYKELDEREKSKM